jgi:hypothetical protein
MGPSAFLASSQVNPLRPYLYAVLAVAPLGVFDGLYRTDMPAGFFGHLFLEKYLSIMRLCAHL